MWVAFLRAFQFLQRIMPCRVVYSPEKKRFVANYERSLKYWFINGQIVQVVFVTAFRMFHYMQSDEAKLTFIDFVMDLMIWSMATLQSCCCWSLYKRRHSLAWFLNEYMANKDLKDDKMDFTTIMLYSLVGVCLIFPVTLSALPLIFSNTAVHTVLRFWLPTFIMSNKVYEIILCALYFIVMAFYGMIPVLTTLISLLILVFEGGLSLKPTFVERKAGNVIESIQTAGEKGQEVTIVPLRFSKAVRVYRKAFLIWESGMQFGYMFYPTLILTAYIINVVTTFACVRLYNELPPTLLGMLAVIDIAVIANTITFHAFALVICFDFEKFYWFWKTELKSRRNRVVLRACLTPRVKIGSFFCLGESTILSTMQEIVDMTVTLLLA